MKYFGSCTFTSKEATESTVHTAPEIASNECEVTTSSRPINAMPSMMSNAPPQLIGTT